MKYPRNRRARVTTWWIFCAMIVVLGGCGDATGPNPDLIPGTWDLTGVSSMTGGQTFNLPASEIAADPATRVFRDDGTGTEHYQGSMPDFTWSTSGGTLTMTMQAGFAFFGGGSSAVFAYGVSSTSLILEFDVAGEGEEAGTTFHITHTFTRR